ncbi:putative dehydrogenase [SAR116 cluster alpha proteobacterium HIMB100]|nr:putative dehydrogenase [SAR116 cluster alpha proteobacterium HIMB100]
MRKLRVGIVGAGIGAEHFQAYLALHDRFDVRYMCDLDEVRAARAVTGHDQTKVTASLNQVLDDPEIDIVDVCLPPYLHLTACRAVLKAGKDVICEKPLVASLAEADQLADLVKKTGRQVFPVFQYRYGAGAAKLRALISAGLTGRPLVGSLETHWHRDEAYYALDWRGNWEGEGGGAILGHAIHIHDWLSFAFGEIDSVFAYLATRVNEIEVEDCASLSVRMRSGALITSSVTLGAATDTSRLRFCFSGLTAESGLEPYRLADSDWRFFARAPQQQAEIDAVLDQVSLPLSGFQGLFAAIYDHLVSGQGDIVSFADGRRSLEFVTAVYRSAREGRPINLPLNMDDPLYKSWLPESDTTSPLR